MGKKPGWPGNVRELKNIIERSLILNPGENLIIDHLGTASVSTSYLPALTPEFLELNRAMAAHIEAVLKMTNGKIHGPGGAAEILGINTGTLRHRMNRLGIVYGRRRNKGSGLHLGNP